MRWCGSGILDDEGRRTGVVDGAPWWPDAANRKIAINHKIVKTTTTTSTITTTVMRKI